MPTQSPKLEAEKLAPPEGASEHRQQVSFVAWYRRCFSDQIIFAIPNGGHRGKAQAGKLKAEGVLRGVWDLYVMDTRTYIEFKAVSGRLSPDQVAFGKASERLGYHLIVAYGYWDAVRQVLKGARYWQDKPSA